MKKILTLALLLCLVMLPVTGHCGRIRWGGVDRDRQLGRQMPYDLIYRGANRGGVSTIVSTVSKLTSTNLAFSLLKLVGCTKTFSMAAGEIGQEITLMKEEYHAGTLILDLRIDAVGTCTAHTGFTSITWPTAGGSFVTLSWIDSTIGWMITGAHGVTITR